MRKGNHGGDWAAYQAKHDALPRFDFSANVSPLGPPEGVKLAMREAIEHVAQYPDPRCCALRKALGEHHGVDPAHILCGNGAADLIDRLALALRPKRALVTAPTFSEYAEALERVGGQVTSFPLREEHSFAVTPEILDAITPDVDVLFLCEPNNPTGRTTASGLLQAILEKCRACGVLVVLDECFAPFLLTPRSQIPVLRVYRLLILRAFTKFYGLAGVRLGYCLCADTELLDRMALAGQPWPVSNLAQAAGVAALRETAYAEKLRALLAQQRPWLKRQLERQGCFVLPGEANYLLFRSPDPKLGRRLERQGVLIRTCADYDGLGPNWFRVAVRTAAENQRLIETMEGLL